jgi:hypothetical protein
MRPPAGRDDIAAIELEAVAGQAARLLQAREQRNADRP